MGRDYRFDVARVVCMTYIVAFVHLYAYIHTEVISAVVIPSHAVLTDSCLGLFTFCSGYLLGKKYLFDNLSDVWLFYKKRLFRIIPLFLIAAIALYLIGFNGGRATLNGVLCISPFITPRPMTLWYIPVIMICYAITPLVSRKDFSWRIICSLVFFFFIVALKHFFPSIDKRLQFNLLFYLIGLVSAPFFDWKYKKVPYIKMLYVLIFISFLAILQVYAPHVLASYRKFWGGVGVFAILFVCEWLSDIIFNKDNKTAHIIGHVSYASMACYMFHRLFFWAGEMIWNPSELWVKWLYMAGVAFPFMLILSYYIQKSYDTGVEKMKKLHKQQ